MLKKILAKVIKIVIIFVTFVITLVSILLPRHIRFLYTKKICSFIEKMLHKFKFLEKYFIKESRVNFK